jgi:serine/threonine-protein kinase RsbT
MTASLNDGTALRSEQDVVVARQVVRRITQELGFSLIDQTKIVTATSEIARNTVKHGLGGLMQYEILNSGARTGLRLTFTDEGPGFPISIAR